MHETLLNNLRFKQAEHYNLPLIKRFYKNNGMRPQAPKGDRIFIAHLDDRLVAALRLVPTGPSYLLRSMCVSRELRHQGIGSALLQAIQAELHLLDCYCFPYSHLQAFYSHGGFILCPGETSPPIISEKFYRYLNNGKDICLMKHQPHVLECK